MSLQGRFANRPDSKPYSVDAHSRACISPLYRRLIRTQVRFTGLAGRLISLLFTLEAAIMAVEIPNKLGLYAR